MVAGLNLIGKVIDYKYDLGEGDDAVGGAQPSGTTTVLQDNIQLRIAAAKPTQAILEQGVETDSLYTGFIGNHTVDILNNHEIEVTAPANSPYFGLRFRILGDPQRASVGASDSRGFLLVMMKRVTKSRTIQ